MFLLLAHLALAQSAPVQLSALVVDYCQNKTVDSRGQTLGRIARQARRAGLGTLRMGTIAVDTTEHRRMRFGQSVPDADGSIGLHRGIHLRMEHDGETLQAHTRDPDDAIIEHITVPLTDGTIVELSAGPGLDPKCEGPSIVYVQIGGRPLGHARYMRRGMRKMHGATDRQLARLKMREAR